MDYLCAAVKILGETIVKLCKLSRFLVLGLLVLAFATVASAQQATIVGTVTDPSGAAVPGVQITITNTDTGIVQHLTTNSAGQYAAVDVNIGHYTAKADASGFKAAEKTGIVLQVGDRTRVDFALEIGATTESVKVEANAVAVQADSGEVSDVVNGQQVSQIAVDGRNIYSLAILTPGAVSAMPGFNVPTSQGNASVSYDGQRQQHNLWMADGSEESDRGGAGGSIINPSLEAVGEFRVLSSNYDASFGLSSAGTISVVFKSGTKDFHAEAWEFVRSNSWDANYFFLNKVGAPTSELHLNVYGFNVGGPVTLGKLYNKNRDKTFFFYNMEWRKMITQGGGLNTQVPLPSQYGGNLSAVTTQLHAPAANLISPAEQARWQAAGIQPGAPIPGDVIPSSLISPNASALLAAGIFPAPNSGNRFIGGASAPTNLREELVRIDHQFSDKFWVFGHWVSEPLTQTYNPVMWSGDNVPTVGDVFSNPSYTGVIHATVAISPTLLNETAFNYDGNRISIIPYGTYKLSQVSGGSFSTILSGNPDATIPSIALQGLTGTNYTHRDFPWTNTADDYQIRDDLSWTKGTHQMKMGGGWAIYKKVQQYFGDAEGDYGFNGLYTGNDFADFLVGYAQNYGELAYTTHGHWDAQSPYAYFQDNWRVNNRLTLNLGLRWDGIPHTYEANHLMANFYPNQYNPANAALIDPTNPNLILPTSPGLSKSPISTLSALSFYANGMGITGENGNPNGMVNDAWNNWGPHVGFAYDISGSGKTVVRGGFAAMYERIQGNDMYNSATNVPITASVGANGVPLGSPGTNLATGGTISGFPISVSNVTALNQNNYKSPVTYQYSFGVQRQFGTGTVFEASYVGNQSRHQFYYGELNLPSESALGYLINNPNQYNYYVPYRGYHTIEWGENGENAHYNGLQTQVRSRMKDVQLQAAYTYSKAVDPAGGANATFGGDNTATDNPYDLSYDKGPAGWDATHVGLFSFVYDLPIFRNSGNRLEKTVIGGWELSGIWTIQSGFPLRITLGGSQGSNGLPNSQNFPDFSGTVSYPHSSTQWFTTSGFTVPALGAWGDYPRNMIRGPGRNNWNVSLFKSFLISESHNSRFELRMETFNTFNHTQFNGIGTGCSGSAGGACTGGNFGQPSSTWDPRTMQFGARLIF